MRCEETKITRRKLTSVLPLSYATAVIAEPGVLKPQIAYNRSLALERIIGPMGQQEIPT